MSGVLPDTAPVFSQWLPKKLGDTVPNNKYYHYLQKTVDRAVQEPKRHSYLVVNGNDLFPGQIEELRKKLNIKEPNPNELDHAELSPEGPKQKPEVCSRIHVVKLNIKEPNPNELDHAELSPEGPKQKPEVCSRIHVVNFSELEISEEEDIMIPFALECSPPYSIKEYRLSDLLKNRHKASSHPDYPPEDGGEDWLEIEGQIVYMPFAFLLDAMRLLMLRVRKKITGSDACIYMDFDVDLIPPIGEVKMTREVFVGSLSLSFFKDTGCRESLAGPRGIGCQESNVGYAIIVANKSSDQILKEASLALTKLLYSRLNDIVRYPRVNDIICRQKKGEELNDKLRDLGARGYFVIVSDYDAAFAFATPIYHRILLELSFSRSLEECQQLPIIGLLQEREWNDRLRSPDIFKEERWDDKETPLEFFQKHGWDCNKDIKSPTSAKQLLYKLLGWDCNKDIESPLSAKQLLYKLLYENRENLRVKEKIENEISEYEFPVQRKYRTCSDESWHKGRMLYDARTKLPIIFPQDILKTNLPEELPIISLQQDILKTNLQEVKDITSIQQSVVENKIAVKRPFI